MSICLSLDGRFALSGSEDKTLRLWDVMTGECLHVLEGHLGPVRSVSLSADSRFALSGGGDFGVNDYLVRLWQLDWDLEARDPADWDEGARPYLETFLTLHTPYAGTLPQDREPSEEEIALALTRRGRSTWIEQDFQALIKELQYAGYGWLRPEGVHAELERMAHDWQGPPPLPQL
jgi:WD40 repeat protein